MVLAKVGAEWSAAMAAISLRFSARPRAKAGRKCSGRRRSKGGIAKAVDQRCNSGLPAPSRRAGGCGRRAFLLGIDLHLRHALTPPSRELSMAETLARHHGHGTCACLRIERSRERWMATGSCAKRRASSLYSSYLNETLRRTRYDSTLPSPMVTSCSQTSATRKSRSDWDARSTAAAAAFSHEVGLVPTISMIL